MLLSVLAVVGARPNFMKAAPVVEAMRRRGMAVELVHTGQHYDANMSDAFFRDLELPAPDHFLGVGSGTHAQQTARIMEAFEPIVLDRKPHWVVVFGDVNSTMSCALVTVKLKPTIGTRVAHVEAGLRSGDWRMPEEVNRVVTDRVSDLLLAPSVDALPNLEREGIPMDRVRMVGNVMIDTLLKWLPRARARRAADALGVRGDFALVTLHRPSNVDDKGALETILRALDILARDTRVVFPMHPRTRKQVTAFGLDDLLHRIMVVEPVGYLEMLSLLDSASLALTDSGGVQEETAVLGVPCVTLREQTERPITVSAGTNRLTPWPLTMDGIVATASEALARPREPVGSRSPEGWDGKASERVAAALAEFSADGA